MYYDSKIDWLRVWYESQKLQRISQRLLFNQLSLAVEVGMIFARSAVNVNHVLKEIPEVSSTAVCHDLCETLRSYAENIRNSWLDIQRSYPEVYKAIQTKHAAYHIINHEAHSIDHLLRQGLLEEHEYEKMKKDLQEALHSLKHKSFFDVRIDKTQTLINLTFMGKLKNSPTRKMAYLLDHAHIKIATKGEKIFEAGTPAFGVSLEYIVSTSIFFFIFTQLGFGFKKKKLLMSKTIGNCNCTRCLLLKS